MKKDQLKTRTILALLLTMLALAGLACNLLSAQEPEPVVDEPEQIDPPEVEAPEEPGFVPQQILQLDFEDTVRSVAVSKDGSLLATGIFMQVDVWDRSDGALLHSFETRHSVDHMAFMPDDQEMVTALSVYGVNLHQIDHGEMIHDFHGGYDSVLALSPDGTTLATGNRSGIAWIWQISDGEQLLALDPADHVEDFSEYMTSIAISPDGTILAVGYWNGYIFLYQVDSGELIHVLEPETGRCSAWGLAFSPDGQHLAVGGANVDFDEMVKIWDVQEGSILYRLDDFTRGGSRKGPVAYSPDGTLLAAGSTDGIFVWELPEYTLAYTLLIEETDDSDWVNDLAFTPDSQFLLAGYWNDYALLWQVQE